MDYLISSGDTLGGIARANKLGVQDILKLNPQITDPNRIMAGQSIKLPGASTSITTPQPTTGAVSNVPNFQASGATVTSNTIGSPITRNDLQSRRAELEKIATQRSQAEQEQQALFETLSNLQRQSEREQQLSQNIAQSGAQETKLLRDLTLEQRQIGRNQQGRLASGVNIASQQAESRTGVAREDLLYKRLIDSAELQALAGVRQADIQALNTSISGKEKFIDRALGIEKDLVGRGDTEQKQTRQTLLDIIDFSQGSTFNELTPEEQTAIANTAQLVGVPLSSVQQAMERNKIAFSNEQAKVTADIAAKTGSGGDYNTKQLSKVSQINARVSANPTYKRFESLRGFIDNVNSSLSQQNGIADIAAINQYQKVIDEGAVTRDQDVALLRSANSLRGKLTAQINKLSKGEQLTEEQRNEMKNVMAEIYKASQAAVKDSAFVKSQLKEAELNSVAPEDTILADIFVTETPAQPQATVVTTGKVGNITYTVKKK